MIPVLDDLRADDLPLDGVVELAVPAAPAFPFLSRAAAAAFRTDEAFPGLKITILAWIRDGANLHEPRIERVRLARMRPGRLHLEEARVIHKVAFIWLSTIRQCPKLLAPLLQAHPALDVELQPVLVAIIAVLEYRRLKPAEFDWLVGTLRRPPALLFEPEFLKAVSYNGSSFARTGVPRLLRPYVCRFERVKYAVGVRNLEPRLGIAIAGDQDKRQILLDVVLHAVDLSIIGRLVSSSNHVALLIFAHAASSTADKDMRVEVVSLVRLGVKHEAICETSGRVPTTF